MKSSENGCEVAVILSVFIRRKTISYDFDQGFRSVQSDQRLFFGYTDQLILLGEFG